MKNFAMKKACKTTKNVVKYKHKNFIQILVQNNLDVEIIYSKKFNLKIKI